MYRPGGGMPCSTWRLGMGGHDLPVPDAMFMTRLAYYMKLMLNGVEVNLGHGMRVEWPCHGIKISCVRTPSR